MFLIIGIGSIFKKTSTSNIRNLKHCYIRNSVHVQVQQSIATSKSHADLKTCQNSYVTEILFKFSCIRTLKSSGSQVFVMIDYLVEYKRHHNFIYTTKVYVNNPVSHISHQPCYTDKIIPRKSFSLNTQWTWGQLIAFQAWIITHMHYAPVT